jgi:hypothetical protein
MGFVRLFSGEDAAQYAVRLERTREQGTHMAALFFLCLFNPESGAQMPEDIPAKG